MKVIAFDTSIETLGIIAENDDQQVSVSANIGYRHGESLLPWVDQACKELEFHANECDLIICTIGPGSFTGLRIGLATAKGISMAARCPVVGVPTLDCYSAGQAGFPGLVYPVIDAKKNRFYTACYMEGKLTTEYLDISAEEIIAMTDTKEKTLFTGPDANTLLPDLEKAFGPSEIKNTSPVSGAVFDNGRIHVFPSQTDLYRLLILGKHTLDTTGPLDASAGPIYLRRSEAEIHHEKMQEKKDRDPRD